MTTAKEAGKLAMFEI